MADWYLDLVGGNDANNGTSFAQRKLTLASVAALAVAAGDTVRVMKTPDATNLGVNGTWTDGSPTVTLSAAVTKNVDMCDTAWTAGAGITMSTTSSASTAYREGTAANSLVVGGGYVLDAVAAYKTLASTDFSSYQLLNLYFQSSAATAAGDWVVRLCSDTVGATPVCSFSLPAVAANSYANAMVIDFGGLMTGATAIQSVSIVRHAGAGTPTVSFDCMFVSKPFTASDCLTLQHVIGKNYDPATTTSGVKEWFSVQSVNGTTIKLSNGVYNSPSVGTLVPKVVSETVALYARRVQLITTSQVWASKSGSATGGVITIEGGYDTSAMTTKTGDTWFGVFSYPGSSTIGLTINASSYISVKNMGVYGWDKNCGTSSGTATNYLTFTDCSFFSGHTNQVIFAPSGGSDGIEFINCYFWAGAVGSGSTNVGNTGRTTFLNCRFQSAFGTSGGITLFGNYNLISSCFISVASAIGLKIECNGAGWSSETVIRNTVVWGGTTGDITFLGGNHYLDNCVLNGATEVTVPTLLGRDAYLRSTNHDQTVGNHQQWTEGGKIISDATTRHTASGIAWKLSPTSTVRNSSYPLKLKIATVYCVSGVQTTVSAYFAKDHANISVGLFIRGSQLGGPASDTTQLSTCGTGSTYESTATQIQWTPTSTGWVEIEAICYTSASTTSNGWVDDFNCVYG